MKQVTNRPIIVALVPYYRPGFRGGGPIASLEALVGRLGEEFSWVIATSDRDYGDRARYSTIPDDGRLERDELTILYMRSGVGRLFRLAQWLRQGEYDLLYVNDMFSPSWGVWPAFLHRLGWLKGRPVLVAPRNQFSPGALGIKRLKKGFFLWAARRGGLWRGLCWQATCVGEGDEVRENVGLGVRVWVAPELPNVNIVVDDTSVISPICGPLRIIFLSRISPKKNLEFTLAVLEGMPFPIQFDVAGPADNDAYLRHIETLMAQLPRHISATYLGPVAPEGVRDVLSSHNAMLLATRGENFGHVILEALAVGCPPIISDRTPWKDLGEKGCGWVVPLGDKLGFRQALMDLNAMPSEDRERMRTAARAYARAYVENPQIRELNVRMFNEVLEL